MKAYALLKIRQHRDIKGPVHKVSLQITRGTANRGPNTRQKCEMRNTQ